MEPQQIIVAGIGTDTGKTVISAILCEALAADYWKPVQAGDLSQSDSITIGQLISNTQTVIHPEAYRLTRPMSPHAAAAIDQIALEERRLRLPATQNHLVIELAGGLMVPLRNDYLNIDWVQATGLPVILVSNYYLGSINHTLLTWELLIGRNIPVMGIIFNGEKNPSTFEVIMHRTQARCLLEVPKLTPLNARIIRTYADKIHL